MIYFGIDPGKQGAIAFIDDVKGNVDIFALRDETLLQTVPTFIDVAKGYLRGCVEMQGPRSITSKSSCFKIGDGFGFIRGVLDVYKIQYDIVAPSKWKKEMGVTKDKETSIQLAKELYPNANLFRDYKREPKDKKYHDGKAEALLIAEYARRMR